jgi:non-specific serine/threonine protein kinase
MCTSREALNVPGEVEWPVPPLDAGAVGSEAVELFRQRAAAALETTHADELDLVRAAELCRRLEGIPLAIELAAAKLKLLSLEELTARIDERFETLTGGSRTAPARHQTLRAAIAWSYELLPEPERALFRRLTTFLGSFTLEAAEAVCVDRLPNAVSPLDGLSSLARKSLIRVERTDLETRYRLLDTIREYGQERLRETEDLQPIGKRHRDYYLDLVERAAPHLRGPTANLWMARLTREQDNIHAALEWSLADGDAETYGRFLIALWWFWYVRCLFDEGRRRIGIALAELQPASPASRVALLLASGQLAWAQGDHDSDRVMFNEALSLARELNDEALLGHVLLRLSLADYAASQMHEAQAHLTESIRLLRKHGRTSLLAEALNNLGWIEGFELNNRFAAAQLLEESLSLARQCGDLWTLQEVLDSMAALKATEGDIDAAEIMQEESLRTNVALGDVWSLPRVLAGFTRLAMVRGQAERALRLAGAASRLRDDVGMVLMAAEDMQLSPLVRAARASLGSPKAEAAWADGLQMTMADAVSYALGDSER